MVIKWQPLAPSIEMAATSLCCQDQGLSVTSHDTELLILLKYTLFNKKMLSGFPGHVCMLSHFSSVQLFGTLWTVALQVPLSMGFSRQEYWSKLPFPTPGDLPDPEIESTSPLLAGGFLPTVPPGRAVLVAQWYRIHLSNAGEMGSIPGLGGSPQPRNSQAHAPQPLSLRSRAHLPQLLKPKCPRARALQLEMP